MYLSGRTHVGDVNENTRIMQIQGCRVDPTHYGFHDDAADSLWLACLQALTQSRVDDVSANDRALVWEHLFVISTCVVSGR